MSDLYSCPRCNAFVNPDWASCRICGYDPANPVAAAGGLARPEPPQSSIRVAEVVGGLLTLVVLVALAWGTFVVVRHLVQSGSVRPDRQEWVTVPKG